MNLLRFIRIQNILIEATSSGCWLTWGAMSAKFERRRKALEWCQWVRKQGR